MYCKQNWEDVVFELFGKVEKTVSEILSEMSI